MTRFLLDTHVWLWLQTEPNRLPTDLLDELSTQDNDVFLSAASAWEIAIKHALGRLALPRPPHLYVPDRMNRSGVTALPLSHDHVLAVDRIPMHHRDPFDRVLVAQARILGLTLVSADPQLAVYEVELRRL